MPDLLLEHSIFSGSVWLAAFAFLFFLLIGVACVTDVRERRIPNWLVGVTALFGLFFSISTRTIFPGIGMALAGMGAGLAIWLPFYMLGVLGAGDVKFFAACAAWLGPTGAWQGALLSAVVGGVLAIAFLLRDSRLATTFMQFAIVPWTRRLDIETMRSMTPERARRQLPYGVALGVGALLAAKFPTLLS